MSDALLSLISPSVLVAIIAAVGAYLTARAAFAEVTLKRRLETAKRFTELADVANNRGATRGLYEQVAAIELLASFGRDEPHLRGAARAVLQQVAGLGGPSRDGVAEITTTANNALATLPKNERRAKSRR